MTENQNPTVEPDDTAGHRLDGGADAERDEVDDTDGHGVERPADFDDVEGFGLRNS